YELPEARPLIAISPEITIMPPMTAKIWLRRNGSMRPETMTALSPQIYEYPTVQIRSGSRMVQRTPAAPASRSRDSPDVDRTSSKAQRLQIWVMGKSGQTANRDAPEGTD